MGVDSSPSASWEQQGVVGLLLCWLLVVVHTSQAQPPLPLSLPAQISVPPPWSYLLLSQADLGPLFSNSSPFSFSQNLLLLPPAGPASKPGARASFGPYSVTQLVSDPILPLSPPLSASLLSEHVERERDEGGQERLRVRALFQGRGDPRQGTCVTLHAFKETEEHKASCITQAPLGLCVVTLTLPSDWFQTSQITQPYLGTPGRSRHTHRHRQHNRQSRRRGNPAALRFNHGHAPNRVQLYYSSFGTVTDLSAAPPRCVEDKEPQYQSQLFYIAAVTLRKGAAEGRDGDPQGNQVKEEVGCLDGQKAEELHVDSNVLIRYRRGPAHIGQPIGLSVNLRSNFSAEFVVIRLKVRKGLVSLVAQRSLTSDLWAVTLERTQGSKHDTISIICHKVGHHEDGLSALLPSPSSLHQVACLSVDGLRRSFDVAMTVSASWWVEYSGRNNPPPPHGGVVSSFSFTDRAMAGIVPVTESSTIINTAILTSEPVSLPVIVLAVGHDGKVSDVTSAVRCQSSDEDIVKVSSDCASVFVDGSESGVGSTCVGVEFLLGTLRGSLCLAVWAPVVPLRLSLSDPKLNAISGWSQHTDNGCFPVFQRSTVQVLTQFVAQDNQSQMTYLLGSPDWMMDVTDIVRNWLRVENPQVATLDKQNNLIGLQPGETMLHVISSQWDGVLGSCDVTVTSEPVTPGDLSVQVVSGLGMSIQPSPAHPSVVTATVTAYNILYDPGQEASINVWLQFSDDNASLLSAFRGVPFYLRLSSLAESVVAVTPGPTQRIVAQGDGGGPLLQAELLVSTCDPIVSNSLIESDSPKSREGGGTRRLARGSGWIRVNLDSDLQPMGSEESEFGFDVSDILGESNGDVYANFGSDNIVNDNVTGGGSPGDSSPYHHQAGGGMMGRNGLERAALTPNHEENAVYLSPGLEREGTRDEEMNRLGERELEVGLGAILSLLCLSTLLFLVNCLPCALRERRRRRKRMEADRGVMEGVVEEEEEREDENMGMEKEEERKRQNKELEEKEENML